MAEVLVETGVVLLDQLVLYPVALADDCGGGAARGCLRNGLAKEGAALIDQLQKASGLKKEEKKALHFYLVGLGRLGRRGPAASVEPGQGCLHNVLENDVGVVADVVGVQHGEDELIGLGAANNMLSRWEKGVSYLGPVVSIGARLTLPESTTQITRASSSCMPWRYEIDSFWRLKINRLSSIIAWMRSVWKNCWSGYL